MNLTELTTIGEDAATMEANFIALIDRLPSSRETSTAKTRLEEAVLWLAKAIALNEIKAEQNENR